jgi:hypothetical protein
MPRGFGRRSGMLMHAGLGFGDGYVRGQVCCTVNGVLIVDLHRFQSYGGFMSSKVVEANAGIHSLAMAVAVRVLIPLPVKLHTDQLENQPVTSWRLYGQSTFHVRAGPSHWHRKEGRFSFHLVRFNIHRAVYGHSAKQSWWVRECVHLKRRGFQERGLFAGTWVWRRQWWCYRGQDLLV